MIPIITKNQILRANIEDVTSNGDGVAKIDGYPLFVKNAVTGDILDIKATKLNKSYGFAEIVNTVSPSKYRCSAQCPVFSGCGGCDFMHISYDYQKELKSSFVKNNIRRIGGINESEYDFENIIGADSCLNYRNKAQFPVVKIKGKLQCGFFSKKSHKIVPAQSCPIQHEDINKAVSYILSYANEANLSAYDEKTHSGVLRHIYIRRGNKTGDIMAVIVTNSNKPLPRTDILIEKLSALKTVKSIMQNINTEKSNLILSDNYRTVWGENYITSFIGELKFKISPQSFFQVNGEQTEKLYSKALEYADISPDETVFDLYCGVGSISLFLSSKAKKVIGVEIVPSAVENAKENAAFNDIKNAEFYSGDCADVVLDLIQNGEKADAVVVDPPRKGCSEELLKLILKINPQKIVYVSCNSATLARDVKILNENGYELKRLCPVDMFPQTTHVETVVLMSKVEYSSADKILQTYRYEMCKNDIGAMQYGLFG